jgi:hypothetical protein
VSEKAVKEAKAVVANAERDHGKLSEDLRAAEKLVDELTEEIAGTDPENEKDLTRLVSRRDAARGGAEALGRRIKDADTGLQRRGTGSSAETSTRTAVLSGEGKPRRTRSAWSSRMRLARGWRAASIHRAPRNMVAGQAPRALRGRLAGGSRGDSRCRVSSVHCSISC